MLHASDLTDPAVSRIAQSDITEVVVTNTIPLPPSKKHPKIKVLSIAPILAETILRIYNNWSVSQLFENTNNKLYGPAAGAAGLILH